MNQDSIDYAVVRNKPPSLSNLTKKKCLFLTHVTVWCKSGEIPFQPVSSSTNGREHIIETQPIFAVQDGKWHSTSPKFDCYEIVTWSYVNVWELRIAYKSGYIAKTDKLYHNYYIFIVGKLESTDAH